MFRYKKIYIETLKEVLLTQSKEITELRKDLADSNAKQGDLLSEIVKFRIHAKGNDNIYFPKDIQQGIVIPESECELHEDISYDSADYLDVEKRIFKRNGDIYIRIYNVNHQEILCLRLSRLLELVKK